MLYIGIVSEIIKSLIPATELTHRGYRSFLPFIGSLSKTLFGTATMEDVNLLANHINALNSRTRQFAAAMQHTENRLSSFISVVDEKTHNLLKGIELNSAVIANVTKVFNAKFITMENILTNISSVLVQQVNEATVIRSNLGNFQSAMQSLVEGKLSPFLVPRSSVKRVTKASLTQ